MIECIIKLYKCEFCCQVSDKKNYIQNHENKCCLNPYIKGCYTCENGFLDENRYGDLIVRCKKSTTKYNILNCSDWRLSNNYTKILSYFTDTNSQSICSYL
jgi:hypothetical protein